MPTNHANNHMLILLVSLLGRKFYQFENILNFNFDVTYSTQCENKLALEFLVTDLNLSIRRSHNVGIFL